MSKNKKKKKKPDKKQRLKSIGETMLLSPFEDLNLDNFYEKGKILSNPYGSFPIEE